MNVVKALHGGNLRSIGAANAVVRHVLRSPRSLPVLVGALAHEEPIIRARAADVLEKVSVHHPEWLFEHKRALQAAMRQEQQEVRWHMAQIAPRLRWAPRQRARIVAWLMECMGHESRIVRACALTALAEMAADDPALRVRVRNLLTKAIASPIASLRARARKLLRQFPVLDANGGT